VTYKVVQDGVELVFLRFVVDTGAAPYIAHVMDLDFELSDDAELTSGTTHGLG
jgi:hypothetical protein